MLFVYQNWPLNPGLYPAVLQPPDICADSESELVVQRQVPACLVPGACSACLSHGL